MPNTSPLPTFLIVGAMRSGTTSLVHYLRSNPQIFMADKKELHFFDHHYEKGLDWYRSFFIAAAGYAQIGEATPNYIYSVRALDRIAADLPNSKLVVLLRNPIDRAYSHYWHNRSRGKESLSFKDALAAEPDRLAKSEQDATIYSYVDRGRYGTQLQEVINRFSRDQLWVSVFEEFRVDPSSVLRDLHLFLGLESQTYFAAEGANVNKYAEFRSLRLRRASKRLPRPIRRIVSKLNVRRGDEYPPMPVDDRRYLRDLFNEEIESTSQILGRDLGPFWT